MTVIRDGWVVETVNDLSGFRTSLRADGEPRRVVSDQDLAVFQNDTFGKVMALDGAFQITSADEFVYNEMMAHVPLYAHGGVERVLIVGGGDGGVAREVLKHPVTSVHLVEIDRAVVDLARAEFPDVCAGAFDDPRLNLVIADGAAFVATGGANYDVIVVDSPDPVGAGAVLFSPAFYRDCRRRLRPGGLVVTQSGMPFLSPRWFADHAAALREAFGVSRMFLTTVPSYTGGPMAHGLSGSVPAVDLQALTSRAAAHPVTTRYWTPQVHAAAFALPPYIGRLVGD